MDANIAIAQAMGLRRVAAELGHGWDDFLQGTRTATNEEFAGEEFAGSMFTAPTLRAFAAEVALKAIAIKGTGTCRRMHDLLQLFDQSGSECACVYRTARRTLARIPLGLSAVHPSRPQG